MPRPSKQGAASPRPANSLHIRYTRSITLKITHAAQNILLSAQLPTFQGADRIVTRANFVIVCLETTPLYALNRL